MKIYTKTGDTGTTSLFGGRRISKDDLRIEAYGTVDELNSFIGLLNSTFSEATQNYFLTEVQKRLFTIGSNLASDPEKRLITPDIRDEDIHTLENAMDTMDQLLEPLRNFILPGGDVAVAYAHVCRTVCRRAERRVITLDRDSTIDPKIIIYLNRLSDYFFVLARYIGHTKDLPEVIWVARKS
ncbi:MAG: cob(I)yrinic acid a,c-diamide adenosyltransferase [Saprospiraceae bacterium]|jgi:cob(I)alamin adenosyltransferase|nr:cob(I)yrinic acid a,c-diamide adenosyltransferase [Saprospiraceae bacterium]